MISEAGETEGSTESNIIATGPADTCNGDGDGLLVGLLVSSNIVGREGPLGCKLSSWRVGGLVSRTMISGDLVGSSTGSVTGTGDASGCIVVASGGIVEDEPEGDSVGTGSTAGSTGEKVGSSPATGLADGSEVVRLSVFSTLFGKDGTSLDRIDGVPLGIDEGVLVASLDRFGLADGVSLGTTDGTSPAVGGLVFGFEVGSELGMSLITLLGTLLDALGVGVGAPSSRSSSSSPSIGAELEMGLLAEGEILGVILSSPGQISKERFVVAPSPISCKHSASTFAMFTFTDCTALFPNPSMSIRVDSNTPCCATSIKSPRPLAMSINPMEINLTGFAKL